MGRRVALVFSLSFFTLSCGGGSSSTTSSSASPTPTASPAADNGAIGEWTDSPGVCPAGMNEVKLSNVDEIEAASRGEDLAFPPQPCGPSQGNAGSNGCYSQDPPGTCYFIQNGTYAQLDRNVLLYVLVGGTASTPRMFVGESRAGTILHGRITIGDSDNPQNLVSNISVANMTFDLTGGLSGYGSDDAFNTLTLNGNSSNVTVDHVTFTGDCATGFTGAHIETDGINTVLVQNSLIENFGHCFAPDDGGHQDHGVYLANGSNITLLNNVIRGNSSRGIQLYTGSDTNDTLTNVTIQQNRIYQNGHADYEDGIVIDGPSGNGPAAGFAITNVQIFRNLIYNNYYSGIRWASTNPPADTTGLMVQNNTFYNNGSGSQSPTRSEVNIDGPTEEANTTVTRNLFGVGFALLDDCYDGASLGFSVTNNAASLPGPSGASGNCLSSLLQVDPQFANPSAGDFHPGNAAATPYGAYAP